MSCEDKVCPGCGKVHENPIGQAQELAGQTIDALSDVAKRLHREPLSVSVLVAGVLAVLLSKEFVSLYSVEEFKAMNEMVNDMAQKVEELDLLRKL